MTKKNKRLWIDMCAGSELKDTQGETLSVEGADINDLELGRGRFNDNHGKGFFNSLGRVTEAKKILKAEDCENDRQKYYWEKIKAPYVYAKGYLYNDEDHQNAKAAAAIIRNIHREDAPLAMKASVEGGVLARGIKDPTRLARTKIHSIALTFTPANNATLVEPLNVDKSDLNWETDKQLIKSVMHLAETNIPSFRHIERHASANTIYDNILKIQELAKGLGVEIEIKGGTPEEIMQQAVIHKVASNINKINDLVKGMKNAYSVMKPSESTQPAVNTTTGPKLTPRDRYEQNIGKLKLDQSVPKKPLGDTASTDNMKLKTPSQVNSSNVLRSHAAKAMENPGHLLTVHKELTDRGVHPDKVSAIINKIHSYIDVKKSCEPMDKAERLKSLKGLLLAGALAQGAQHIGDKDKDKITHKVKPTTVISAETKVHTNNSDVDDPDKMISPKKQGYDERKPNAKEKFYSRRKKIKKALIAGYGGAGAPGNLTGGGVIQAESLEGSRKAKKSETTDGMTYISCDECGHEQVYMKHQVKCRSCGQNFSLSKLKDYI